MKNFNSYITAKPYKGAYTRNPFMVCPRPQDGGPQFAVQGCLVDWAVYGGNVVGASVGVNMNLTGRGAAQTIKRIEAVYIDNTFNSLPVYVVFPDTGYTVIALPNAIVCEAVYTANMEANIYCDGFDGVALPLSRVLFLEHFVSSFNIVPPTAPAAATVPTIESSSHGNSGNVAAANFACVLPAGITAGDLLLLIVATSANSDNAGIVTPATWTLDTGPVQWNQDFLGGHATLSIFKKIASGAEGATVTVAYASGNGFMSYGGLRIDKFTKGPQGSMIRGGTDANPAPPTLTPAWGNNTNLWLAVGVFQKWFGTGTAFTGNPANYTQVFDETGDAVQLVKIRVASRLLTAPAQTPSPFTMNGDQYWGAATYAIGQ